MTMAIAINQPTAQRNKEEHKDEDGCCSMVVSTTDGVVGRQWIAVAACMKRREEDRLQR